MVAIAHDFPLELKRTVAAEQRYENLKGDGTAPAYVPGRISEEFHATVSTTSLAISEWP